MNIGTGAARKCSNEAPQPARHAGTRLSLPLEIDSPDEDALRAAWTRSGPPMPYHVALQNRALAICRSYIADAMRRKSGMVGYGADGERGSHRASK